MGPVEFGKYIRQLRRTKRITIRQLEQSSGVSNAYLSQIENGRRGIPSPEVLDKISGPLGVSYDELMKKAGYLKPALTNDEEQLIDDIKSADISDILTHYNLTLKGKRLNENQKKSMLSFIKTLMDMSDE